MGLGLHNQVGLGATLQYAPSKILRLGPCRAESVMCSEVMWPTFQPFPTNSQFKETQHRSCRLPVSPHHRKGVRRASSGRKEWGRVETIRMSGPEWRRVELALELALGWKEMTTHRWRRACIGKEKNEDRFGVLYREGKNEDRLVNLVCQSVEKKGPQIATSSYTTIASSGDGWERVCGKADDELLWLQGVRQFSWLGISLDGEYSLQKYSLQKVQSSWCVLSALCNKISKIRMGSRPSESDQGPKTTSHWMTLGSATMSLSYSSGFDASTRELALIRELALKVGFKQ
eukprot:g32060.t1